MTARSHPWADTFGSERVALSDGAEMTLRALAEADGESLAAFYDAVPREDNFYYAPHPLTRDEAMKKAARATDPRFVCLVLEDDAAAIAGYAWFGWRADGDRASSFGICVRREHQGLGAGRALMTRIVALSRTIGPGVISLTVQKSNDRAFALYRKMGFEVVREQRRASDGEPEYYMELELGGHDRE